MNLLIYQERAARVRTAFADPRPDAVLRAADERLDCNALLEDYHGGGRYCSRECWGAEGGDL